MESDYTLLRKFIREVCGGDEFADIMKTAERAHTGQFRRSGEPYIEHPLAVAQIINRYYPGEKILCTAALLHDSLEDSLSLGNFESPEDLRQTIIDGADSPEDGQKIFQIVQLLTHAKGVNYNDYLMSLSSSPDALRVKLADMLHNLQTSPSPRQAKKYGSAIKSLETSFGGPPPSVSSDHWADLINATNLSNDT